jgi:hypothetical protein
VATRLLPEPVGVDRITFDPVITSISASSWAAYRVMPCSVTQAENASYRSSASAGTRSLRVMARP